MKNYKRILAVIMAGTMLTACGSTATSSAPAQSAAATSEAAAAEEAKETEEAEETEEAVEEAESEEWDGEITEINLLLYDLRGCSENAGPIVDAMNEITEKTIGVHANISWANSADYTTQVGLEIASGTQLDVVSIMPRDPASFTAMIANQQLMEISEYLEEEAPETMEMAGDYIKALTVNGGIYGIPCYRNYASGIYLIMREDVLDELGLLEKAEGITTWSETEEIFQEVLDKGELAPIAGAKNILQQPGNLFSSDAFADVVTYDALGDSLNMIYAEADGSGKVGILPESEDFRAQQDMVREWYNKGYVYKDSAITDDHVDTLTKAGVVFASVQTSEMGVETSKKEATGYDELCIELNKNLLSSSYINKFGFGVPVTSEEPEAACRWMNAVYTNPELENLLIWGIEGEDYVVVDGVAQFPEGVSSENVSYHGADFVMGNYFNAYPWSGNAATFREDAMAYLKSADISPYVGFTCDQSGITNTVTALNSVNEQYKGQIYTGAYTDEIYDAFLAALKTAGVDDYQQVYQDQLDAWMAANN